MNTCATRLPLLSHGFKRCCSSNVMSSCISFSLLSDAKSQSGPGCVCTQEEETQVYPLFTPFFVIFSLVLLHPLVKVVNNDGSFDTRRRRSITENSG